MRRLGGIGPVGWFYACSNFNRLTTHVVAGFETEFGQGFDPPHLQFSPIHSTGAVMAFQKSYTTSSG
jgi:hypothetical protein